MPESTPARFVPAPLVESNEVANLITQSTAYLSSVLANDPEVWLLQLKTLKVARDIGLEKPQVVEKISYWHNSYHLDKQIVAISVFLALNPDYSEEYSQNCMVEIESCKSRLLNDLVSRQSKLDAPPSVPKVLIQKEISLATSIAEFNFSTYVGQPVKSNVAQEVYEEWRKTGEEIRKYGTTAQKYLKTRSGKPLTWEEMLQLVTSIKDKVAIISLFVLQKQVVLCVLCNNRKSPRVVTINVSQEELHHYYITNYKNETFNHRIYSEIGRPLTHRWRELGKRLLAPILYFLNDVNHLIIIPEGPLHLLPLHSLALDNAGRTLLDNFTVSYSPSLSILAHLLRRPVVTTKEALILGYTDADAKTAAGKREKSVFLGEAEQAAQQLGVSPVLDQAASGAALRTHISDRALRLLHLSCHGRFDDDDPLQSGVLLADGLFTGRDFMDLRFQADLVTLSACQTGLSASLGGDEMAGLSQALLYAGASSLLMGLWSVNALTTAALMADLYLRLWGPDGHKQMSKAQALREAALALRRGELIPANERFDPSDPYYWSPFVLVGDWR
jgi:CHAT domain-containing protein